MAEQSWQRDPIKHLQEWFARNRRRVTIAAVGLVIVAGGVWFYASAQQRKEVFARSALEDARTAAQAGNLALAASDLKRLVDNYGGTRGADEATIFLAQVRLLQEDPSAAVQELRQALSRGMTEGFRAPAYGLLGAALENLGNHVAAGEAYLSASEQSSYQYLAAQYLNGAGRAFAVAGDTTRASGAYQRVLQRYEDSPSAVEARVRLAELQAVSETLGS